ncbi:hypothetical protein ACLB2K_068456 [Fragaria x ananassa]
MSFLHSFGEFPSLLRLTSFTPLLGGTYSIALDVDGRLPLVDELSIGFLHWMMSLHTSLLVEADSLLLDVVHSTLSFLHLMMSFLAPLSDEVDKLLLDVVHSTFSFLHLMMI